MYVRMYVCMYSFINFCAQSQLRQMCLLFSARTFTDANGSYIQNQKQGFKQLGSGFTFGHALKVSMTINSAPSNF